MDDQQRARELWSDALRKVGQHEYAYHVGCGGDLNPSEQATLDAITAALRAAPDAELHAAAEDFYNTVATQAAANELQKSVLSWGLVVAAGARLRLVLLNQHRLAVVSNGPQVVSPPALGAHEVHPEAVHAGLDLGESGERLLAADALEHAASVSADCDGSATAPDGFVLVPVEPSVGVLASMAIRRDHGLGCPGYYDAPVFGAENVGHQRRMEVAIGEARQQYAEVVGSGFYSLDREGHYAGLAARPQGVKDRPVIDGCTESNCKRCRTHPDHRGSMEHAGIGCRPDSPQEASDA